MKHTYVYVDGFNLYYGALKGTPFKWLNIATLCEKMLPGCDISHIRFFTANVSATPEDPQCHIRQQVYLRALRTIPNLSIHHGHFLRQPKWMPLVDPAPTSSPLAKVWKTEEKGSDVSLATHMVHDAHIREFDQAVLVSNDSDLLEPVRVLTEELGIQVGILNPHKKPARQLLEHSTFFKQIRAGVLGDSQFPVKLQDDHGFIHKPPAW